MDFFMNRIKLDCGMPKYADNPGKYLSELFGLLDEKQILRTNGGYRTFLKNLKCFDEDFVSGQLVIAYDKNITFLKNDQYLKVFNRYIKNICEFIQFYFNSRNNFLFLEEKSICVFDQKTIGNLFSELIVNAIRIKENMGDQSYKVDIIPLGKKVKLMDKIKNGSDFLIIPD